ncbi:MAG: transcriptional regulator NrdR [Bdellovibrionota bacterium]
MKCPKCGNTETKVLESRLTNEGRSVRRRRCCRDCDYRYTTYEREEEFVFNVKKREGYIEPYDRNKVMRSIQIACQKRPVTLDELDFLLRQIERAILEKGEKTITTIELGDMIMDSLHRLDKVAYVRFASVYKDFRDPDEFQRILNSLKVDMSNELEG